MTHSEHRCCADLISRTRRDRKYALLLCVILGLSIGLPMVSYSQADHAAGAGRKTFIDYFQPIPVSGKLSKEVWGAATVGPRDPDNGLEDNTMKHWNYWDGKILRGPDRKYRMFASRWDQAIGHNGWFLSKAVEAVSTSALGPYHDEGLCWPDNEGGKGHNVTAVQLANGSYAAVVSESRNGDIFTSSLIDGPWTYLGGISVNQEKFHSLRSPGDTQPLQGPDPRPWHGSNVSLIVRPDGRFEIVQRSGQILIGKNNILGPYDVQGDSFYRRLPGLPQDNLGQLEDPLIWFSGGWYHVLVNNWGGPARIPSYFPRRSHRLEISRACL